MDELDDLIDGWIDGTLDVVRQRRLESMLDRDPSNRNRFHTRLQVEGLLRQQVRLSSATPSTATASPSVPRRSWLLAAGFSAAALLALAVLLPHASPSTTRSSASPDIAIDGIRTTSPPHPASAHVRTITVLVRQGQTTISKHQETLSATADITMNLRP